MEDGRKLNGLRIFLLGTLHLMALGKKESCDFIEENLAKGIATTLYQKYTKVYDECGFNPDNTPNVDTYYDEQWNGVADGKEGLYVCGKNDGLQLLIALALNEIF